VTPFLLLTGIRPGSTNKSPFNKLTTFTIGDKFLKIVTDLNELAKIMVAFLFVIRKIKKIMEDHSSMKRFTSSFFSFLTELCIRGELTEKKVLSYQQNHLLK